MQIVQLNRLFNGKPVYAVKMQSIVLGEIKFDGCWRLHTTEYTAYTEDQLYEIAMKLWDLNEAS